MARTGITQAQVDAAADALLKAGERPTIERVRAFLGTGSPNTLVRLVDDWWSRLGGRLIAREAKLALPQAPKDVVDAASALWMSALESARRLATADLASERTRSIQMQCVACTLYVHLIDQELDAADGPRESVSSQRQTASDCMGNFQVAEGFDHILEHLNQTSRLGRHVGSQDCSAANWLRRPDAAK